MGMPVAAAGSMSVRPMPRAAIIVMCVRGPAAGVASALVRLMVVRMGVIHVHLPGWRGVRRPRPRRAHCTSPRMEGCGTGGIRRCVGGRRWSSPQDIHGSREGHDQGSARRQDMPSFENSSKPRSCAREGCLLATLT
jgi:hypothetical protein